MIIHSREAFEQAQLQQFKTKYTINLDWLEFMLSGHLVDGEDVKEKYEFDGGNIILAKVGTGTKVFKHRFEIYMAGNKFGTVNVCPRSPEVMKSDAIQFKVENNILYEMGALSDVKKFFDIMLWNVTNITRCDIALDGVKVLGLVDKFLDRKIEKLGKAKVNPFLTGKRELEGFDIGSKSSDKWITGYIKTDELERSGKSYIQKFWERTGLDTSEKIERLELKLRNEAIKKISGFNWKDLDNFEYLASVFRTEMKNFFEFVELGTDTNSSRKKRIEFVDWDFLGANLLERLSTKETTEVYRMRQASKTAYWCYLASGEEYYARIGQEMAMNVNCLQWYFDRIERWRDEYAKKCGRNADGVISFQYLLHFETYKDNQQLVLWEKS